VSRRVLQLLTHTYTFVYTSPTFSDHPIPDPVKLLRRLVALELRIDQLRRDCADVANGRKEIALAVTDTELKNAHILRKVSGVRAMLLSILHVKLTKRYSNHIHVR